MIPETLVAGTVRDEARRIVPGHPEEADAAVLLALHTLAGGASVAEAVGEAVHLLHCYEVHPSHRSSPGQDPAPGT